MHGREGDSEGGEEGRRVGKQRVGGDEKGRKRGGGQMLHGSPSATNVVLVLVLVLWVVVIRFSIP